MTKAQRDRIERLRLAHFVGLDGITEAWDTATTDPWGAIADERRVHRCSDANCFAESVLMRLGALRYPATSWDEVSS
jgi:hypothetical protein